MSDTIEAEIVLCVQNEEFNAEIGNDSMSGNFTPSENAIKDTESSTSEKARNEDDNNSYHDISLGSSGTSAEDIVGQVQVDKSGSTQSGVKGKDTGLLSLLSSLEQKVPSRQIQSDYDFKKVFLIADTILMELTKGKETMLNALNHFRNAKSNYAVSNIGEWKLILFSIIKHFQPSSKKLENKIRNKIKMLEQYDQRTVCLKDLNLDQKYILLNAVIDEVRKLSELSLSDLQNLSIWTVQQFGKPKKRHLKDSSGCSEYSLESSIIQLHHQIKLKSESGSYSHYSIEQALVDQLNSIAREMDLIIKSNQIVTEYFRKQQVAFEKIKMTEKKILKWKALGPKATWTKNRNLVQLHLFMYFI